MWYVIRLEKGSHVEKGNVCVWIIADQIALSER